MNRAVFLDRDGTINVDKHYLHRIEDFEFIPKAVDGLRMLHDAGFLLIIVTNQSGIARGYYSEEDYIRLNNWMLGELEKTGVKIAASYYCPHLPDAQVTKYRVECKCRKPGTALFEQARDEFDINLQESWAIGDRMRDLSICDEGKCRGILINTTEEEQVICSAGNGRFNGVKYAPDLYNAAKEILNSLKER